MKVFGGDHSEHSAQDVVSVSHVCFLSLVEKVARHYHFAVGGSVTGELII